MRALLSTYASRGDVEPLTALTFRLRELGAELRMCGPPDKEFVELLSGIDVEVLRDRSAGASDHARGDSPGGD
jgi:vancomycin aglycone glucosyltransferase